MESREVKLLQDKGALPKEEGDVAREYKAMHEEHFPSSWLRKDGRKRREEKWRQNGKLKKK